jgi:hypothetical protein
MNVVLAMGGMYSVGEWTWLFTRFPLADIELMSPPIEPQVANVLVRTFRAVPGMAQTYEVRVAPHNVAPFRAGPWIKRFSEAELESPGDAVAQFRTEIWEGVRQARHN